VKTIVRQYLSSCKIDKQMQYTVQINLFIHIHCTKTRTLMQFLCIVRHNLPLQKGIGR